MYSGELRGFDYGAQSSFVWLVLESGRWGRRAVGIRISDTPCSGIAGQLCYNGGALCRGVEDVFFVACGVEWVCACV